MPTQPAAPKKPRTKTTFTPPAVTELRVEQLYDDPEIQQRAGHVDPLVVAEYAEAMARGDAFPPLVVFRDVEGTHYVADGFHRLEAARKAERKTLAAELRAGTRRDALLYAVGANATHGLKRTDFDKRKAVTTLLRDEEWSQKSDRWIADTAKVSPTFVGKVRAELTVHVDSQPAEPRRVTITRAPEVRTGRDGRTINTGAIGKKPAPKPAPTAGQTQQAAARFAGTVSDLKAVVDKLTSPEVSRLANLAAGVLGDLLELLEGVDAQAVVDELQERVEAVWRDADA